MKIALRAFSLISTLDSSEIPENFSTTAFHSPCNTIDDFILIFHKLKLIPPSNFGTSYFANDVDTLLDEISPQITPQISVLRTKNSTNSLACKLMPRSHANHHARHHRKSSRP